MTTTLVSKIPSYTEILVRRDEMTKLVSDCYPTTSNSMVDHEFGNLTAVLDKKDRWVVTAENDYDQIVRSCDVVACTLIPGANIKNAPGH